MAHAQGESVITTDVTVDMVLLMGAEVVVPEGSAAEQHRRFTDLWKQVDGRWQLTAMKKLQSGRLQPCSGSSRSSQAKWPWIGDRNTPSRPENLALTAVLEIPAEPCARHLPPSQSCSGLEVGPGPSGTETGLRVQYLNQTSYLCLWASPETRMSDGRSCDQFPSNYDRRRAVSLPN